MSDMVLIDFLEDVYFILKFQLAHNTRRLMRNSVRLLNESLGRESMLSDLTEFVVAKHLKRLLDEGRSPHSVKKTRSDLLAMSNFAARRRLVNRAFYLPPVKVTHEPPFAFSKQHVDAIFNACGEQKGEVVFRVNSRTIGGVLKADYMTALVTVLFQTAERKSAVLALTFSNVHKDHLYFPADDRKGSRYNICAIDHECYKLIQKIKKPKRKFVFDCGSKSSFHRWFGTVLENAGVPSDRGHAHAIRRTSATMLVEGGATSAEVQQHLCHSDPNIQRVYVADRAIVSSKHRNLERLPKLGGGE